MAKRAFLGRVYFSYRPDSLAGKLHKTEFCQRQHIVLCAVRCHQLLHILMELIAMFGSVHIDEIDYDYASHIAKPQLSGNLFRGNLVHLEGVLLLITGLRPDSAVDIDDVESFRGLNHKIGPLLHRYYLSK